MSTHTIEITNEVEAFLRDRSAASGFDSSKQYIEAILTELCRAAKRDGLVTVLLERVGDCERGGVVPATPDDFDRLRREFLERIARKQAS